MIFRVADNSLIGNKPVQQDIFEDPRNNLVEYEEEEISTTSTTTSTTSTEAPKKYVNGGRRFKYQKNHPDYRPSDIYYYHPRDLIEVETNNIYQPSSNEALRYTSGARGFVVQKTGIFGLILALSALIALFWAPMTIHPLFLHTAKKP